MTELCHGCGVPSQVCARPEYEVARLKAQAQRDQETIRELRRETEAWRALATCRALLHRGDDGYWFELHGKVTQLKPLPSRQAADH